MTRLSAAMAAVVLSLAVPAAVHSAADSTAWSVSAQQTKNGAWKEMSTGLREAQAKAYALRHCINPGAVPDYATKYVDKATGAEHIVNCDATRKAR